MKQEAKKYGCCNILVLRADPPASEDERAPVEGGFPNNTDIIQHIRKHYDDYFEISVEGRTQDVLLPPDELATEIKYLKAQIDAGASLIFTQIFYDVTVFFRWVAEVRNAGISVPIVPAIAPIQTWNGFIRSTTLSKTQIPKTYLDVLEPYKHDDEQFRSVGVQLVSDMCHKILASDLGIQGLHFVTMNLEKVTKRVLQELNLVPRVEVVKPLPWRQVLWFLFEGGRNR